LLLTSTVGVVWLWDFIELIFGSLSPCKETPKCWSREYGYLQTQVITTAAYLGWFTVARMLLFLVPAAAAYVSRSRTRGRSFCRSYVATLALRDGPHYILMVGAAWLFLRLLANDIETTPPGVPINMTDPQVEAIEAFKTYSIVTCALSVLCFMLGATHNKFIDDQHAPRHRGRDSRRGAPPGTIDKLASRRYDPAVFGDEEGNTYPADCAICLCSFETDDEIKVTPCGHAFHRDCIAHWLNSARTCALCRADLAELVCTDPGAASTSTASVNTAGAVSAAVPSGTLSELEASAP
jgi:hypothetical protein